MLSVRRIVFAGALLAVVPFAAVAQEKDAPKAGPKIMPVPATGPAPATPPPPGTQRVCKMVPTWVEETRTVMKPVQKTETYTAYREETVQEKKMVQCTTYKKEHYTEMVTKTCCVKVPVYTEKTVMVKKKKIEWVTEYKNKCKISFTKECKTIGGHGCLSGCLGDKCGDKCGGGHCGKGLTIPIYKPHITRECVPCTVPKCTWECVPVTKKCCTWKTETQTKCVPVCKTRCVPCVENKEVVTCKKVCVPYQATRCVTVCEPCVEKVQVCKMVPTWVDEPCAAPAASQPCAQADTCDAGHGKGCCNFGDKFSGCCDKIKGAASGCCEKIKNCCSGVGDKFKGCCSKIKGCFSCK
jgi:hypothetical protein